MALSLEKRLKQLAGQEGIDVIKFTDAAPFQNYALEESSRRDPRIALSDAKSVIICGIYIGGFQVPDPRIAPSAGLAGLFFPVSTLMW